MVGISTIMLSFHRPNLLEPTIHSYYKTISVPFELTVVDNASNQPTIAVLRRLSRLYKFNVIYLNKNISGLAFNKVINQKIPKFKYIHFSENDVLYHPKWDVNLIDKMNAFPKLGQISPYSVNMTKKVPFVYKAQMNNSRVVRLRRRVIRVTNYNVGSTCLIRKELIKRGLRWHNELEIYPSDSRFSQDVKKLGYHVAWNNCCVATHLGEGKNELINNFQYYIKNYSFKGRIDMLRKIYNGIGYDIKNVNNKYTLYKVK